MSQASAWVGGVVAASIMADRRGWAPSLAMERPSGVRRPASSAPSWSSRAFAAARAPWGGASGKGRSAGGVPQAAQSSARPESSASRISGRSKAGRPRCSASLHRRMATPGASRPPRPARCSAAARLMRIVSRRVRPVDGSSRGARRQPPSTTMRTPGTVSEVSAMEVESTTRRLSAGRSALSCSAGGRSPWEREHERAAAGQRLFGAADLAHAGQEGEDVAVMRRQRRADGVGHGGGQVAHGGEVAFAVFDADREQAAGAFDDLGVQQRAKAGAVGGGGHRQQAELRAQFSLEIEAEGERQVGVECPFVHLVEDHAGDAFEIGVCLQAAHQQPLGDDLDAGGGGDGGVEAGAVADAGAHGLADQRRHACGRGAGGEAAGFEHDDLARAEPGGFAQGERDQGGLAGAGRCDQHGVGGAVQRREQGGQAVVDGEVEIHRCRVTSFGWCGEPGGSISRA